MPDWTKRPPLDNESTPPHDDEPHEIDWSKPYADCTPEEKYARDAYQSRIPFRRMPPGYHQADEFADAVKEIASHLPKTVAAGVVADIVQLQEKIPAELHVDLPEEIGNALTDDREPGLHPDLPEAYRAMQHNVSEAAVDKRLADSERDRAAQRATPRQYDHTSIGPIAVEPDEIRVEIARTEAGTPVYEASESDLRNHLPSITTPIVLEDEQEPAQAVVHYADEDTLTDEQEPGFTIEVERPAIPAPGSAKGGIMPGYTITNAEAFEAGQERPVVLVQPRQFGKGAEQARRIRRALGMEEQPIVIGLGGYQEHGKDALADILVEQHGFMKFGMSDRINEILLVLNPWVDLAGARVRYADIIESVGYTKAKEHPEVRRLLRILGTEVGRDMIDPDIWVQAMGKKILAALDDGAPGVAVTGIRNGANEMGLIRIYGGSTVWVDRPGHPIPDTTHASENTLKASDFDMTVINDGTLDDLAGQAHAMLGAIRSYRAAQRR